MNIPLLPEQIDFITSKNPIVQYVAGIGAGKTFVACIKATQNALGGRYELMLGLTYSAARDVIFDTLLKVFDLFGLIANRHYTVNKSELNISFIGGGKILIRSAEVGNRLRGLNISDAFIDEAGYLKDKDVFDIVLGRLRDRDDGQLYITTSPCGFNYIYDLSLRSDVTTIKVSTFKNSFLPDRYIKTLLSQYSSTFIQQELYAEFVTLSNGMFNSQWIKDYTSNETIVKLMNTQSSNIQRVRFWDFAFSSGDKADYSAGVLLAKVDGRYVIEDIVRVKQEYVDLKKTIVETAIKDGKGVQIGFEKAGQQKAVIGDLSTVPELALYVKKSLTVAKHGSKLQRILPLASQAELGNIYIKNTCRNKVEFKHECDALTVDDTHQHDDMVDACASAYILFNEIYNAPKGLKSNIY
jgi:predicted phage terminase large subunit-like protein